MSKPALARLRCRPRRADNVTDLCSVDTPFDRNRVQRAVEQLAGRGVFIGASSWKYPGWNGLLYDEFRYVFRGKYARTRFERDCLREYAEVFKTVCVDAAYYRFPDRSAIEALAAQVPEDFRFAFKVTDEITIKRFTRLARFGERAGKPNKNFLNADLFAASFLGPCEPFKDRIGPLLFEFSRFYPSDFVRGRDFVAALDGFLRSLPAGWRYGVEIRNRNFLHPEYFATLARHGVAHVFNSWQAMPDIGDQLDLPDSRTADFTTARFLLRPGRGYEEAVNRFKPYNEVKDPDPRGREAGARLISESLKSSGNRSAFLYVNNRFEGNAPGTIAAMLERAGF